jgi:uncharacterized membrane protein YraQ (UPF0718 family)
MDLFLDTFLSYTKSILPWIVVGSLVAYFVDRAVNIKAVRSILGKTTLRSIVTAQILGMVSPLSVMSALPITGELIHMGAKPLMLVSFLLAERAYDLQSFFIISNLFGPKLALVNAFIIFTSLIITALCFKKEKFKINSESKHKSNLDFWRDQSKTFLVVVFGIFIGALLRVVVPLTGFAHLMSSWFGGLLTGLLLGFGLYFGTILGNYPVAKSLSDLGMPSVGTLVFLSVSPLFNFVVIMLFVSAVKARYILKMIGTYTLVSLLLSVLLSFILH